MTKELVTFVNLHLKLAFYRNGIDQSLQKLFGNSKKVIQDTKAFVKDNQLVYEDLEVKIIDKLKQLTS